MRCLSRFNPSMPTYPWYLFWVPNDRRTRLNASCAPFEKDIDRRRVLHSSLGLIRIVRSRYIHTTYMLVGNPVPWVHTLLAHGGPLTFRPRVFRTCFPCSESSPLTDVPRTQSLSRNQR